MNERIKELAKQAGMGFGKPFKQTEDTLYIKSDKVADAIATDAGTHQEQVLKFAELLIKECIMICDKVENDYLNNEQLPNNEKYAIGAGVCRNTLYKHFGVKE